MTPKGCLRIELHTADEQYPLDVILVNLASTIIDRPFYDRLINSTNLLLRRNGFKDEHPQIAGTCSNCAKVIWSDEEYQYDPDGNMFFCLPCSGLIDGQPRVDPHELVFPSECPHCARGFSIRTLQQEYDGDLLERLVECRNCGAQWTQHYRASHWGMDFNPPPGWNEDAQP